MQTETHGVPPRVTDQGKDTQQPPGRRKRRWWIGIGIVVLLVIGANRGGDEPAAVTSQPATQPTTAPARPAPAADSPPDSLDALADAWADAREAFRRGSSTTASPAPRPTPSAPAQPSRATPPPTATRAVAAAPTPAAPTPTPTRRAQTPPAAAPQPAPSSDCHSSYRGACVPIASDVDCAGGSGNGPAYARGPFEVVGPDVYGLDADKDGIACE